MIKQEITELLKHAEQKKIIEFVAEHAKEDEHFYEKIKKALLPDDSEKTYNIAHYRKKAEDCFNSRQGRRSYNYDFYEAAYEAASGLNSILSDASFFVEQGKYADAVAMAMAVAEVIPRNYENVDDSDGELGDTFNVAIELLCDIVNNSAVTDSIKKEIYNWSKKESNDSVYSNYGFDEIQTIYETCCEQLGDTNEVLSDIDKQIRETSNEYLKSKIVLRKIRFMQSRNLNIQDVIQEHLDLNDVRKIRFEQLMNDKKYDEALRIAKQGIEISQKQSYPGTETEWQKSIFDIYLLQGDTARLLPLAEYLFQNAGWNYNKKEFYSALKKHTSVANWPDTMERLLARVENAHNFNSFTAQIMHEHQLWPRLFAYCQKAHIAEMEIYENDLKPHFEKEILECYRNHAEKQALITDQRAYDEVGRMLKRMKTFTDGNELVNQLLEKYRATYKRRKNMMEVLKKL